ncbi:hypothetical protein B5X24_HaOG204098 [Helicoverpa armigera]|uniref:Secreted protein n=1 Tax=Helicoverpa armigera TaxID=29058 RepID=A0A2W1BP06_HELAM|nr:hypothetical protein B5X24_HaOG204098 [Helicoverpa armigera]
MLIPNQRLLVLLAVPCLRAWVVLRRAQGTSRAAIAPIIYERRHFFIVRAACCRRGRELSVEDLAIVTIRGYSKTD